MPLRPTTSQILSVSVESSAFVVASNFHSVEEKLLLSSSASSTGRTGHRGAAVDCDRAGEAPDRERGDGDTQTRNEHRERRSRFAMTIAVVQSDRER